MKNWDGIGYAVGLALQALVKIGFLAACMWAACAPHM